MNSTESLSLFDWSEYSDLLRPLSERGSYPYDSCSSYWVYCCENGDYGGSFFDAANRTTLAETFDNLGIDYFIGYSLYSEFIAFDSYTESQEIADELKEIFNALTEYPVLNDELYYSMEYEQFIEQWDSYTTKDVLSSVYEGICLNDFDLDNEPLIGYLRSLACQHSCWCLEYNSVYYDVDRLAKCINDEEKHKVAKLLNAAKEP